MVSFRYCTFVLGNSLQVTGGFPLLSPTPSHPFLHNRFFCRSNASAARLTLGIRLLAKEHLVSFYQSCGCELVGPSAVVHGKDPWFELKMDRPPQE